MHDLNNGLWLSITEIADRKGVGKAWISERVKALEAEGKIQTRRKGRAKLVNLAQYDRAVGEVGDAAKELSAETRICDDEEGVDASPKYRDHHMREKNYAADLKFLELEERLGNIVPVQWLEERANRFAETVVQIVERLPMYTDAMTAAVAKTGVAGAHAKLEEAAQQMRREIAEASKQLGVPFPRKYT